MTNLSNSMISIRNKNKLTKIRQFEVTWNSKIPGSEIWYKFNDFNLKT